MFGSNTGFGGASSATNTGSTPAPSAFGNAAQGPSTSNAGSVPNHFGGLSFGSAQAGSSTANAFATGTGASTTPNLFGGATTGGAGGTNATSNPFSGAPSGGGAGIFGSGGVSTTTPATTGAAAAGAGPSMFGNTGTASTGATPTLFGNAATTGASGTAGISGTSGLFLKPPATTAGVGTGGTTAAPPSFFATPPASGAAGASKNLFSNAATTTNATPSAPATIASSVPNFFAKAAEKKDNTAPASAFNLGGTATGEKKDGAPVAPTTSFSLFGNKDATGPSGEKKDVMPATATSASNLFGGSKDAAPAPATNTFNWLGTKDTGSSSSDKKNGAPTFSLGGTSTANKDAPAAASTFSFGSSAPTAAKDDKSKETSVSGTVAAPAASTSGATTTPAVPAVSVPPPSMLRGKTIEEIVNRWSSDLDAHVREFNKFAGEVAVWDRALIENGNNLATLFAHVLAAEREQTDIDQALDHIEQQQRDLTATLEVYEKSTDEILGGRGSNLRALDTGPADTERDKNYTLATELHGHLDDLSASLAQMIDAVNALALPSTLGAPQEGAEDPMTQIAQILNSHLESLVWIDGAAREVESKINDVEKRVRAAGDGSLTSSLKPRGFGLR